MESQYIDWLYAKYIGGHVEYPASQDCRVFLYYDHFRIHLWNGNDYDSTPTFRISYKSIHNIENMDEKKISAKRVIALGLVAFPLAIVGAIWKKNHVYTVIEFVEQAAPRAIVLDLGNKVSDIQGWIYHMMISHKQGSTIIHSTDGHMVYENRQYGFSIRYPETWIMDESNQNGLNYTKVVEFRKSIESKPPRVTVFLYNIDSKSTSLKNFVNERVSDIKKDSGISVLELSGMDLNNRSSFKLIDVKYEGYKRMVTWVPSDDKVYEISYSSIQEEFLNDLSVVQELINSFEITNSIIPSSSEGTQPVSKSEENASINDPILILKLRYAKGEITEEEFERMLSVLKRSQC